MNSIVFMLSDGIVRSRTKATEFVFFCSLIRLFENFNFHISKHLYVLWHKLKFTCQLLVQALLVATAPAMNVTLPANHKNLHVHTERKTVTSRLLNWAFHGAVESTLYTVIWQDV
jgi:hypothetical protein